MPSTIPYKPEIGIDETVSLLGVSSATIRNWIKHNYLTPLKSSNGKLLFDFHAVEDLNHRIQKGEIARLNKRANKRSSTQRFIPEEYAGDKKTIDFLTTILTLKHRHLLSDVEVLFAIAFKIFEKQNLIHVKSPLRFNGILFSTATIQKEFKWWLDSFNENKWEYLKDFDHVFPLTNDILGLVYQSLKLEGSKAQGGSYYTPTPIVSEIVKDYVKPDSLVLDPCCGTGQFLLSASKNVQNPDNLWGFDIDEIAVHIARLNMILQYPNRGFEPHIYHQNTLLRSGGFEQTAQKKIPQFDVVITNPPWGVHFSANEIEQIKTLYPSITSKESFSYFLLNGMDFLKPDGVLSFILPESILNIKTHRDIRQIILNQSQIIKIKYLDRPFKKVFTPVIRLDIRKSDLSKEYDHFTAMKNGQIHTVSQKRLEENSDFIFDVFSDKRDLSIFNKVYAKNHATLKDNADWALGIVTGDNKKYLLDQKSDKSEPILTGKDIKRFSTKEPRNFVVYEPKRFQQVAPEAKYRAQEKLLYKFISKELIFAYDDKQRLTLNSANILIPRLHNYPVKTILVLFNSSIYQFIHQKKFGALKVLRGDLEKLPLPILSQRQHNDIARHIKPLLDISTPDDERTQIYENLNNYIMSDIFKLSAKEQEYIRNHVSISNSSLSLT